MRETADAASEFEESMLSIRQIGRIGHTYRNLNRFRQILAVLLKYGFSDLLDLLKLDAYVEAGRKFFSKQPPVRPEKLSRPQGLRFYPPARI